MKFGIAPPGVTYPYDPVFLAKEADERGFESIWFSEHTHVPAKTENSHLSIFHAGYERNTFYDPFLACMAAATTTSNINVGTSICILPQRDAIITAKEVATLDRISKGRFLFGIGAGWNQLELASHRVTYSNRFSRMREQVLAMKAVWRQEVAEFHGRFIDFEAMYSWPKPLQAPYPPILLGGDGPRTLERVVDYCDGWMPMWRSGRGIPSRLGTKIRVLRENLEAAGRSAESVEVTIGGCPPDSDLIHAVAGMGVDRVIFVLPSLEKADVAKTLDDYTKLMR